MLRMKELRGKRTQAEVARQLGLTQRTYQNYEIGARQADYETLARIAKFYGVSVGYLLGLENSLWTDDDLRNGVVLTKKVDITVDEDDILEKCREVCTQLGAKGKDLIIDFCDMLLEKYKK